MIGELFGNYRALSVLGEGGMGVVYLAEHPEIGRKVAVKVLHADFARDQQVLARFLNEARAANAIRHPNIIEILDSGALADRTPFLVMELLEGESLSARIKRVSQLPIHEVFDFAYQTASALSAAHAKGIVHRDLKPDNLFLVPDPNDESRERIKVLDFGIAKLQQQSAADSVKTRTGTLMGTPIYMSPEQCRGIRAIDHRTDIYSLGVILYEMVVGHPPFVSEGFGDLVNMHMNMPPPPPGKLRADLPPALEALILTMLAKAPEQRFDAMPALQSALKAAGEGFFTARGSSPDLASKTRDTRSGAASPSVYATKQTTLTSAGAGERIPYGRPKGRMLLGVLGLAALAGAGLVRDARGNPQGRRARRSECDTRWGQQPRRERRRSEASQDRSAGSGGDGPVAPERGGRGHAGLREHAAGGAGHRRRRSTAGHDAGHADAPGARRRPESALREGRVRPGLARGVAGARRDAVDHARAQAEAGGAPTAPGDRRAGAALTLAVRRLAVLVGAVAATAAGVGAAAVSPVPPGAPSPAAPALTLPFDGVWGVVQGFDSGETHHGYAAFALDFAPPQDVAQFARLVHPRLQDFACFGRPVLAPADGRVVRVVSGLPDLPPYNKPAKPKARRRRGSDSGSGNFVIIQHADRVYTELVHLQAGSVRVAVGDRVRRGQPIGACGNSGNARTPHLHLGLLSSIDPITTARLPLTSYEVRDPRDPDPTRWIPGDGEPKQGQWVRPTARQPSASDSSGR